LRLGEQRTVGVVGRAHLGADWAAQVLRELVLHVPDLPGHPPERGTLPQQRQEQAV